MPEYKLYYFDVKGLGEAIRLVLHYVGQPFQDIRISSEQWEEMKASE
jgi:prostaglandin-H2 D-isomerase / glutathione transferase